MICSAAIRSSTAINAVIRLISSIDLTCIPTGEPRGRFSLESGAEDGIQTAQRL